MRGNAAGIFFVKIFRKGLQNNQAPRLYDNSAEKGHGPQSLHCFT